MKYPFGNNPVKIEAYKKFWRRDAVKRPLTGFSFKSWLPVLSPELYRKYVKPVDEWVCSNYGSPFIHLHATSMIVLDDMLEIPGLNCFEVNNDVGGPPVSWLVPHLRKIQNAKKSLLVRGSFNADEMRLLMGSLDPAGLYLYIMIKDIREAECLRTIIGM